MAVEMIFDKNGRKLSHRFTRALIRTAAALSYGQAQAAIDGDPDDVTGPLLAPVLKPLWAAYGALRKARKARGPLELDLPERKIVIGNDGRISRIFVPGRLAAHMLIEEFMIQANVAAAETLEAAHLALIYRIHETPPLEKIKVLADFLDTLGRTGRSDQGHTRQVVSRGRSTEFGGFVKRQVGNDQAIEPRFGGCG